MMNDEEDVPVPGNGHPASHSHPFPPPPNWHYGTFRGVSDYPPPPPPPRLYYPYNYQIVPGYAVVEGLPVMERRLPCCGIGCGWFLFIVGFFLIAIPWYVGLLILVCGRRVNYREKPGLVACTISAILATIAMIIEAKERAHKW